MCLIKAIISGGLIFLVFQNGEQKSVIYSLMSFFCFGHVGYKKDDSELVIVRRIAYFIPEIKIAAKVRYER